MGQVSRNQDDIVLTSATFGKASSPMQATHLLVMRLLATMPSLLLVLLPPRIPSSLPKVVP
jgi:hypothetical protein